jgi:hypothetical protein
MREVYGIGNRIDIGWIYRDELIALAQFQFPPNAKVCPRAPLLSNSRFLNGINERLGTAIQNWQLQIIQFDHGIIDAAADACREHVLSGGNQDAFFHQARGIADSGNVAAYCLHLEPIEIDASEDYARARRRRQYPQLNRSPTMQTDAAAFYRCTDCLLLFQFPVYYLVFDEEITAKVRKSGCV